MREVVPERLIGAPYVPRPVLRCHPGLTFSIRSSRQLLSVPHIILLWLRREQQTLQERTADPSAKDPLRAQTFKSKQTSDYTCLRRLLRAGKRAHFKQKQGIFSGLPSAMHRGARHNPAFVCKLVPSTSASGFAVQPEKAPRGQEAPRGGGSIRRGSLRSCPQSDAH